MFLLEEKSIDRVVRAMTEDGQFRVIAVTMPQTCAEAARRQAVPEELAGRQAHLMCASVLVRETMQPGNRVQIILKDPQGHRLVADSLPDGKSRSIVNPGTHGDKSIGRDGLLQVNYTLRNGDLHQGIVSVDAETDVSTAMMRYLRESEQIAAFVSIESVLREDGSTGVGGFVVQVTPEVERAGLVAMTDHLEGFDSLPSWLAHEVSDPEDLIAAVLKDHEYALLANSPLSFGCTCSEERMLFGLSRLSTGELGELVQEDEAIEVSCDACGERYQIGTDELAKLLGGGKASDEPPN